MSALDALAAAFGIEPSFTDARGAVQTASEDAKRALLAAFGVPVQDDAAARAALEQLERTEWERPLAPTFVTTATSGIAIPLTLAAGTQGVLWRLELEDGSERSGSVEFSTLRQIGSRSFGAAELERREFVIPRSVPHGYHRLRIGDGPAAMALIVAPERCVLPATLIERKAWGLAVQLYLLRSRHNWGIGDYGDLCRLVQVAAAQEADVIGLNPLHALFLDDPEHVSPYSPASRLLLNVFNIDVTAIPELAACGAAQALIATPEFQAKLETCRVAARVRYTDVAALKLPVLRLLFANADRTGPRFAAFEQFVRDGGEPLRRTALFQALRSHFTSGEPDGGGWRSWPTEYHDAASDAVARFAGEHRDELAFLVWLQWIADDQLAAAAATANRSGMRIGLYRDLAVGADPDGAETWANAAAVVHDAAVGAPPDIYNPQGQNWGLPPFHPRALHEEGYRSFVDLVRSNMRHAGAIRIDHVMALQHVYLIPEGHSPADGAYVTYPREDLIGILALESARGNCLVVGEDLGTVPAGFRERMEAANILSYRVLYFEKEPESGGFLPPERYPERALAVVASHDLPTLRAWMSATDIDLRLKLGLLSAADAASSRETRESDRAALYSALRMAYVLPRDGESSYGAVLVAAHAFLARTPCLLAMAQIDDVTGELDPVNVPTTTEEHPNWRRRISESVEELATDGRFVSIAAAFVRAGRRHG